MRPFQTQAEAHGRGRIITDTRYDDHGLVREQTGGYLVQGEPQAEQFTRIQLAGPHHDPPCTTAWSARSRRRRSTKAATPDSATYGDTWTLPARPAAPRPPSRTSTDALGRVTSSSTTPTATQPRPTAQHAYSYDARGNRQQVKDPAGNVWTYNYDSRGRMTDSPTPMSARRPYLRRPDRPKRSRTPATSPPSRSTTTGRVKAVREGSATASPIIEYAYDPTGALGQLVATTRTRRPATTSTGSPATTPTTAPRAAR